MTDLKVVPFTGGNLRDVPALAKRFAEDLEAGNYGDVSAVTLVLETDGVLTTLGWGDADVMRAIGMLFAGATSLSAGEPDE